MQGKYVKQNEESNMGRTFSAKYTFPLFKVEDFGIFAANG